MFVDFVRHEDNIRNDPSFNFAPHPDVAFRPEKPPWKLNRKREVSVHKTEILSKPSHESPEFLKKKEYCDEFCPRNLTPSWNAGLFQEKPIAECRTFIKENNICFKCCNTALHPGPAPWIQEIDHAIKHGGEQNIAQPNEITSKCTQVCGES